MGGHSVLRSNSKLHDNFGKMPSLLPPLSLSLFSLSLHRMEHTDKDKKSDQENEGPDLSYVLYSLHPNRSTHVSIFLDHL